MTITEMRNPVRLAITFLTIIGVTIFGFSGVGWAQDEGFIQNTGPDSDNSITFENHERCEVENNNDVHINNTVNQSGQSGDAEVSHNTTVSGWGAWDPVVWQNQGYTYAQWEAAFSAYMHSNIASWQAGWGSLSGSGGATSGDVSNMNTTNVEVAIDNSNACNFENDNEGGSGGPGSSSHNPQVLGSQTSGSLFGTGGLFGLSNPRSLTSGGGGSSLGGSGAAGSDNNPGGGNGGPETSSGGCTGSIHTTGPDSSNSVSCITTAATTVNNNTTGSFQTNAHQNASSGSADVGANGSGGGSTSGDAGNQNSTSLDFSALN